MLGNISIVFKANQSEVSLMAKAMKHVHKGQKFVSIQVETYCCLY